MIKKFFLENRKMKIASLLLAIIVWVAVTNYEDPIITQTFYNIPVTCVNDELLSEQGYTYSILSNDHLTVVVEGRKSKVSKLTIADFSAQADFSLLSIVNSVPVNVEIVGNAYSDVSIVNGDEQAIRVELRAVR